MLLPVPQFPLQNPKSVRHCWGLKDCLLQAQLPSPSPLILDPFGAQNASGSDGVTLSCSAPQNPGTEQVPRAPSCSFCSISPTGHLAEQISGRFLLIPRSQPRAGCCLKQGGDLPQGVIPTGSPPQGLTPAVLSPESPVPLRTGTAASAQRCHTGDRRDS